MAVGGGEAGSGVVSGQGQVWARGPGRMPWWHISTVFAVI